MDVEIFWTVFIAASLAHAIYASIVYTVVQVQKARKVRQEKELADMYVRAVEYMNAGNQEAAEMMASRYREKSGRGMPPIFMAVQDDDDEP